MSVSTVSVARRRSTAVGDTTSGSQLVIGDGIGGVDKITSGGGIAKYLSDDDSIREPVLSDSAAALPSRTTTRKGGVSKHEKKPLWQTTISVLAKNSLFLLVVLGFLQLIYKLALDNNNSNTSSFNTSTASHDDAGISDFEKRVAEMESFVKRATQMVQFQVDVVDHKISNEIGALRGELSKKIEDEGKEFTNELKKLETRIEGAERYFGELSGREWLTREDFDKFLAEFERAKGIDTRGRGVNLDEVRAFAREIVEEELGKHAADGLGRVDYALASGGAVVVKHSDPLVALKVIDRFYGNGVSIDANKMITPSLGEPGHCFPLKGSVGFVEIKLRTSIIPQAITLEHVAKSVAYDRSSAPKDCRVYGWLQGNDATILPNNAKKILLLTEFTYDLDKSSAQTFDVLDSARSGGIINRIRLDFSTNYGSSSYTCIYRLRVHGHELQL